MNPNTPLTDNVQRTAPARLSTADLAAAGQPPAQMQSQSQSQQDLRDAADGVVAEPSVPDTGVRELAQLFPPEIAGNFRSRWDQVQIGFVDDPGQAVREADELVAEVMKSLADSFAKARSGFEQEVNQAGNASTESLRVALQRYRSFFQRLLSL